MRQRRGWASSLVLAGLLSLSPGLASEAEAVTIYTDRAVFEAAAGPLTFEGFNTDFTAAPSVDFGDFAVNAASANVDSADGASLPQLVSEGARSIYGFDAAAPSGIGNSLRFLFDSPIRAFGIDINDYASGVLSVEGTASLPATELWNVATDGTPPASLFFGVVDTTPFSQAVIVWNNAQDAVGFDALAYGVVPEPSSALLLAMGLAGLALRRRLAA